VEGTETTKRGTAFPPMGALTRDEPNPCPVSAMDENRTGTVKCTQPKRNLLMVACGQITGASTTMVVAWLEEDQGADSVDALFTRLDASRNREITRDHIEDADQVDYTLHVDLLEEVADIADADADTVRAIGYDGAMNVSQVVPGAGIMLKVASPQRLLDQAPKIWGTYADFGDVDVVETRDGYGKIRIRDLDRHPQFCRTLEGLFEGLIERAGGEDVSVRELDHDGVDGCVFEGEWTESSGFF
jgi:uncharacterized protein (TIGR02265 family)